MSTEIDPKKIIAEVSGHDIDQWVRTAAFKPEVEEAGGSVLSCAHPLINIMTGHLCDDFLRVNFGRHVGGSGGFWYEEAGGSVLSQAFICENCNSSPNSYQSIRGHIHHVSIEGIPRDSPKNGH
jgi:hypothetical protein